MFRLFECCALSFFERFVLSFSLKIERFVSDSAEIWICGLYFMQGFTTKYYLRKAERGDFVVNRQAVTLHTRKTCQVPLRHNSYQTARKRMCEYREEKISCKRLMVYKKGVAAKRKICRGIFFSFGCTMGPECFTKFGKRFSLVH